MSVSNVLEHYLEARRNARVLNVPIAEVREESGEDGFTYFFRDSVLFRRKQQEELELGSRPTESVSLAAGDEAAERRLWAKVLDTEDSEEQMPVLESHSVLATSIWVIIDYGINVPVYQGDIISQGKYITPVMWMLLTLGYVAYVSRKAILDGSLDRKFGGWLANACMGVRGTLDPARTIRHLPTIVFMSWIALRIAVFSAISFDDPGITQCSATIEDACKRPWISVLVGQASVIFYAAAIMLLITFRLDLCPGAHEALLQEAKALIEVYPPIEDVLIAAELKVQASDGLSTRSWFHRLACLACCAYALFVAIIVMVVENEDFKLGGTAVFVAIMSGVSIGLSCYALLFVTYGLSATYNACVVRMQMLSTFLHDHAIENIRLLQGWWKLRVFYLRIVTPICYDSVQGSAAALGLACIFFLAILCIYTINPPNVEAYDDRMKVNGFGFLVVLTLLTAPSSVIMLQKANSVIAEQVHHIELLSRKCMGVRAAALGLREGSSRIHKAKDSLRKLKAGEQGSEEAGQREEIELLVSDMIEHIERFDPKPTFLGIELGPTTLNVLYGYITTAVSFVIVVILHEANVEIPPFT